MKRWPPMSRSSMPDHDAIGNIATVIVAQAEAGLRLDRALSQHIAELSRSRLQALIKAGRVTCDGEVTNDPGRKIKPGEVYAIAVPEPEPAEPGGEEIPLDIVFEDRDLIVLDKPAGLVVHPAAGHATGTLVNALIAHCGDSLSGIGGVRRPGIVHRLDKDTSGLLVVAKNDRAHQELSAQFAAHGRDGRLERRYLALVWGAPQPAIGIINAALHRSGSNRTKIAVTLGETGREAVTHYRITEVFRTASGTGGRASSPVASLVELQLETGRTHQIRVHLAHIGHPVMGDATYGAGFKASIQKLSPGAAEALGALGRQALHAAVLGFEHPRTGKSMRFEQLPPAGMKRLLEALKAGDKATAAKPKPAARPGRSRA